MNQKQQLRDYISLVDDIITAGASGADLVYVDSLMNLHTAMEGILAADGQKPKVQSVTLTIRAYSNDLFGMCPIIVQTAGSFMDTVDLAGKIVDVNLDSVIDDVYGYQLLHQNVGTSRRLPTDDATASPSNGFGREFTVTLPQNAIQLLNKEIETERLQSLYFAVYGFLTENNQVITLSCNFHVKFKAIRKTIILR